MPHCLEQPQRPRFSAPRATAVSLDSSSAADSIERILSHPLVTEGSEYSVPTNAESVDPISALDALTKPPTDIPRSPNILVLKDSGSSSFLDPTVSTSSSPPRAARKADNTIVTDSKGCQAALSRDASPDAEYFNPSDDDTDSIIRECVDEFSIDGRAIVFRERHPLEDGQRRRIIDRSITRRVTRCDNPGDPPPGVSTASPTPILTVDKVTPLLPSISGRPTFEDHARALSLDIPTALQRLNAGVFWPSTDASCDPPSSPSSSDTNIIGADNAPVPTLFDVSGGRYLGPADPVVPSDSTPASRYNPDARWCPPPRPVPSPDTWIQVPLRRRRRSSNVGDTAPPSTSTTRGKPRRPLTPVSEISRTPPTTVVPSPDDSLAPVASYPLEGLWPAPSAPLTPNPQPKRSRSRPVIPRPRPPRRIQPDIAALSKNFDREVEAVRRAIATTPARAAPSPLVDRFIRSNGPILRCPKVSRPSRTPPGDDTVLFTRRNSELGRLWSSDNDQNLLSEYQLERYGIGIVKLAGGKFLCDHTGRRFPLRVVNSKYVIPVGRYDSYGTLRTVTFIVDSGSPFHIVSSADADRIGFQPGGGNLSVSGFGGSATNLTGGRPWFAVLRDINGRWCAPSTQLTPDLDGPVTDVQLALLLQRFSADPVFEAAANVALPVTLRSHSRRPCNRAHLSPTESSTDMDLSASSSTFTKPPSDNASSSSVVELPSEDFDRYLATTHQSPLRVKVTPTGLHGSVEHTPETRLRKRVERSQDVMDTMNVSRSTLNEMIKRNVISDAVAISECDPMRAIDREVSGAKLLPRPSSTKQTSKKQRIEFEPFHLVYCDAYEGMDEINAHNTGHRYVLRFVDHATGYKKDYSTQTKDQFSEAFTMFLAWIRCVAPIIEKHRNLPPGYIRLRVLCSDRDSNFTTIHGGVRTKFDDIAVQEAVHRYFADTKDSKTAGAVESTFGPSTRRMNEAVHTSGYRERMSHHAWFDNTDKSNYVPTTANRLGNGEAPNATLGFSTDISRFRRFGCPGTVNVSHLGLYVQDDGSVGRTPPSGRIGIGRGGKVSRVKSLPCFYLRTGGGLTTNECHKLCDFGGWLVYCPALDNDRFNGHGIVASRSVTWHSRLYPERHPDTLKSSFIDTDTSVLCPTGTTKKIPVSALMKTVELSSSEIATFDAQLNNADPPRSEHDEDIAFSRYAVGRRDRLERSTISMSTQTEHTCDAVDDGSISPSRAASTPEQSTPRYATNVGDSFSGQRQLELQSGHGRTMQSHGVKAGKRVKLMKETEARALVAAALGNDDVIFHWDMDHEKEDDSKIRFNYYREHVKCPADFRRERKVKLPGRGKKNAVIRDDLVHDVQRGILTFLFPEVTEAAQREETQFQVNYVAAKEEDVTYRILTLKPNLSDPENDPMFQLYRQSGGHGITARQLELMSTMQFVLTITDSASGEPKEEVKTLREAMRSKDWPIWLESIKRELDGLVARGVWKEVHRSKVPKGHSILPSHLVFKIKYHGDGTFDKAKSRLVCGGHRSVEDVHYYNSSSHMVTSTSLKMLAGFSTGEWGSYVEDLTKKGVSRQEALELASCFKLHTSDISQAFVVADWPIDHPDIYMELPNLDPKQSKNQYVAHMQRMLYGLKDAGRNFERYLDRVLRTRFGAKPTVVDRSVYKIKMDEGIIMLGVFVDDIIWFGTTPDVVARFKSELHEQFNGGITGGGIADSVLGLTVSYDDNNLTCSLCQPGYIRKICARFGIDDKSHLPKTPLPTTHEDIKHLGSVDKDRQRLFQQMIGCMTWCTHQTKPEAMVATSILSQHCHNPSEEHVDLARHALGYLYRTQEQGIVFHGSSAALDQTVPQRHKLWAMVDANLGGNAFDERSRSCFVIMLNGGPVAVKIMKQTVVARSTGHAEMQALSILAQYLQFCTDLASELGYSTGAVKVLEDNSSVCLQAGGDHQAMKSGHYRRDQAYVDEYVNAGKMFVDKVESKYNTADLGTKAVKPIELFEFLRDRMTGYDPEFYMSPRVQAALNHVLNITSRADCFLASMDSSQGLFTRDTHVTKKGALSDESGVSVEPSIWPKTAHNNA